MHVICYYEDHGNMIEKSLHDGGKNTYTFSKDGSKIILFPLKDEGKAENMLLEKSLLRK